MTKLLEKAIEEVRKLSDAEQDEWARLILSGTEDDSFQVDDETRAAVREGLEQARRGEFVSDEDMDRFFKRHGV